MRLLILIPLFFACKSPDVQLNVHSDFPPLTKFDSSFVAHILDHDTCINHCVFKLDSHILLCLKKPKFDRVYYLKHDGFIDYWLDIYSDTIIYSGKESD